MKYLVALPVPEPNRSRLLDIQRHIQPSSWRQTMDPHITLLAPDQPLLDDDAATRAFLDAPLPLKKFEIASAKIEVFSRRHYHTLVLVVESPMLEDLYRKLTAYANWQKISASIKRRYVPHITLANGLADQELYVAQAFLSSSLSVRFMAKHLALYHKQASWPSWKELASRPFADQ